MSNQPKSGSSKGFLLLFILLIAVVAVVVVLRSCSADKSNIPEPSSPVEEQTSQTPQDTETPEVTPSESIQPSPSAEPTPAPTPSPTPTPVPTPAHEVKASGSFSSHTDTGMNIVLDWQAYSSSEGVITIETSLYVESYTINVGKIYNGATVTVNGESYTIDSPEVKYEGDKQAKNLILSKSFTVPYSGQGSLSVPISAAWKFKGQYSGKDFDSVTTEGMAVIG